MNSRIRASVLATDEVAIKRRPYKTAFALHAESRYTFDLACGELNRQGRRQKALRSENKMELTLKDRLILSNQYRILEKLHPDESDQYIKLRKVLENGYKLEYLDCFGGFDEELGIDDCRKVYEILGMHRALHYGFKNLVDKSGTDPCRIKFLGFDGNNETKFIGYTRYIIEDLNKFGELKSDNPGFDSHIQMLPRYQPMLAEWRKIDLKYELTKADIQRIVEAR